MWGWYHQMWEKKKRTIKCDKSTVTCDTGIAQYEDGTVKCQKTKKWITKCDKNTVKCDVGTAQCEDGTVKWEKKIREPPNVTK